MAISDNEKEFARAYNVGALLSQYEPKLLEQIIRRNKNHEFVKVMKLAKDHREFSQNIPRKDFTKEYKNGFNNAFSLAKNDPPLLDQLLKSKKLHKDYLKGLEAGKAAVQVSKMRQAVADEKPKAKQNDKDYLRGFNDGYQLHSKHKQVIDLAVKAQQRWSPYIEGLQAGSKQFELDAGKSTEQIKAEAKLQNKASEIAKNAEMKLEELDQAQLELPFDKTKLPWRKRDQEKANDNDLSSDRNIRDVEPGRD